MRLPSLSARAAESRYACSFPAFPVDLTQCSVQKRSPLVRSVRQRPIHVNTRLDHRGRRSPKQLSPLMTTSRRNRNRNRNRKRKRTKTRHSHKPTSPRMTGTNRFLTTCPILRCLLRICSLQVLLKRGLNYFQSASGLVLPQPSLANVPTGLAMSQG